MKNVTLIAGMFFTTLCFTTLTAQSVDISKASEGVVKIAKHNASKWKDKLVLSVNQTKMMQDRIIAFEMKKNAIFHFRF